MLLDSFLSELVTSFPLPTIFLTSKHVKTYKVGTTAALSKELTSPLIADSVLIYSSQCCSVSTCTECVEFIQSQAVLTKTELCLCVGEVCLSSTHEREVHIWLISTSRYTIRISHIVGKLGAQPASEELIGSILTVEVADDKARIIVLAVVAKESTIIFCSSSQDSSVTQWIWASCDLSHQCFVGSKPTGWILQCSRDIPVLSQWEEE